MKEKNIEIKEQKLEKHKIKEPNEYEEIIPSFFKFEKINDKLEGILTNVITGERFNMYTLSQYSGEEMQFHGSKQLDSLLSLVDIPSYIKIIFTEERPTDKGSNLKIFKVFKGKN